MAACWVEVVLVWGVVLLQVPWFVVLSVSDTVFRVHLLVVLLDVCWGLWTLRMMRAWRRLAPLVLLQRCSRALPRCISPEGVAQVCEEITGLSLRS